VCGRLETVARLLSARENLGQKIDCRRIAAIPLNPTSLTALIDIGFLAAAVKKCRGQQQAVRAAVAAVTESRFSTGDPVDSPAVHPQSVTEGKLIHARANTLSTAVASAAILMSGDGDSAEGFGEE
jgi:hypothetical protein